MSVPVCVLILQSEYSIRVKNLLEFEKFEYLRVLSKIMNNLRSYIYTIRPSFNRNSVLKV